MIRAMRWDGMSLAVFARRVPVVDDDYDFSNYS